ncbi:MAG: DUF192 domain-containing protein [Roseinatronobacter sp.]|nr:MAG: DUF192 domain-containing protein [Roseinatronobacter sp.]
MTRILHILCAALVMSFATSAAYASCAEGHVDLRGAWGQARFSVEIVDTEETRAQGLMHREHLPRNAGMLFIYDAPTEPAFWMRNTLIPLDMIFVDPTGQVTRIHPDAIPHDTTPIPGGPNVLMVLEINGGLSQMLGMTEGSEMRHPRLDQDTALWPCE